MIIKNFAFKPGTVSINKIYVDCHVRYWEDCEVGGEEFDENTPDDKIKDLLTRWNPETKMGLVDNERLLLIINPENGHVENYVGGSDICMYFKVCDECSWKMVDENDNEVLGQEDEYVPDFLEIDDNGYGDYIEITIRADGFIKDWDPKWFARWVAEASASINGSSD